MTKPLNLRQRKALRSEAAKIGWDTRRALDLERARARPEPDFSHLVRNERGDLVTPPPAKPLWRRAIENGKRLLRIWRVA